MRMFALMVALVSWRHEWETLCCFWFMAMGTGQAVEAGIEVIKKVGENKTVQEAGKGVLARWLDSGFKH